MDRVPRVAFLADAFHEVNGAARTWWGRARKEMCRHALRLMRNPAERKAMGAAGRERMLPRSWDDVFHSVYQAYAACQSNPAQ
jgi:hypothetical protein